MLVAVALLEHVVSYVASLCPAARWPLEMYVQLKGVGDFV